MPTTRPETIHFKRSRFSSRFPINRLYSPAHYWLEEIEAGLYRVGFTKFATRMLGDVVEYGFELKPGEMMEAGQTIAWVEGFKALTDVYAVADGEFIGINRDLEKDITKIDSDPYVSGWLYEVRGTPDFNTVDVHGYMALLDAIIEKMLRLQGDE